MTDHDEGSEFLHHVPCDRCGSSDARSVYSDGHEYCFSCGDYSRGDGASAPSASSTTKSKGSVDLITDGEYRPLTKRGLTQETCEKWSYKCSVLNGEWVQIAEYRDTFNKPVAQKLRFKDKDFKFIGAPKDAGLFGQHLWRDGGKYLVITEGELDAMSLSQAQGHKWPVVSIKNGAPGARKAIAQQLDWVNKFENIVLMFDNDEAGMKAARDCVSLFPDGRCRIAKLPLKDANEMLVAGRSSELRDAVFSAKAERPDGLVTVSDVFEQATTEPEIGLPWWLPGLNAATFGRRPGEAYAIGAGTGIGKTDFITQQIEMDVFQLGEKVGLFILEQQPGETVKRICGKHVGKRFHVPSSTGEWDRETLVSAVKELEGTGKVWMYDNFGCSDWDVIVGHIRYLAHVEGVRLFYLDHLTALATGSSLDNESEREALERIMAELGALVKELNIILTFVSHLSTPEGKPHEEGGRVTIRHFKGSRAIGYWSHYMFGLERNQQADDPKEAGTTIVRVLKDRLTGQATGQTFFMGYDAETGRLFETSEMFLGEDVNENPFATDGDDTEKKGDF